MEASGVLSSWLASATNCPNRVSLFSRGGGGRWARCPLPLGGERGPELVAGVGHDLPYPRLALLAGVQGAVDVVQHAVERGADLADLGVRVALRLGHPLAQVDLAGVEREFGDPGG